ncbi:hypothetical protein Q1W73_10555 [Asticcacaulis sp. ZE23SCel15]|uniref:hypothetical protein n=1 Tax=Asticcacaulis sp. ZE23SCel15 TaxID=3059027 RepID=UPI00265E9462|nr:hypothetical protein [Asticcacaulis sp. ZE23SCel15]WKL56139.1 hypothetical protein Q1W73_10555 [Asticcacaulis sp. ZE23SCel15]
MAARKLNDKKPILLGLGVAVIVHGLTGWALWQTRARFDLPEVRAIEAVMVEMPPVVPPKGADTPDDPAPAQPKPKTITQPPEKPPVQVTPKSSGVPTPAPSPTILTAPIAPKGEVAPASAPSTSAPQGTAPGVVTPKAYGGGGTRGALTKALLKRELCQQQRLAGKVMDKDCALEDIAKDAKPLPLQPPEKRAAKLCIAEREKDWKRYRDGTGQYPGLRDMFKGRKDCLKDWRD